MTCVLNLCPIQKPTSDDGGDYKCIVKNEHGQLQAKLNLNIEAEPPPEEEEEEEAEEVETAVAAGTQFNRKNPG